jgi:heme exporter protein D
MGVYPARVWLVYGLIVIIESYCLVQHLLHQDSILAMLNLYDILYGMIHTAMA